MAQTENERNKNNPTAENVLAIVTNELRPRLAYMMQNGRFGKVTAVVTFQNGVPQILMVTPEEIVKFAAATAKRG